MERIETGDRVSFYFTLSLTDGTRVEGTEVGEPWQVVVGDGSLPAGLDRCLLGLAEGEHGQFFIAAPDAFGEQTEDAREVLPRAQFPTDVELIPGMAFGFTLPDGSEVMGQILAVAESGVEVDFSHPLAGHDLVFDVNIVAVAHQK
ncbi:MAG TPA: FKBP-type peptidyl-prolyl cis-trans isomerase [Acidiferrobacter sp.]|nr:FKBP-type peptidyl-prolyl cis-trans isomerase [Acidiferrobacter sp.]